MNKQKNDVLSKHECRFFGKVTLIFDLQIRPWYQRQDLTPMNTHVRYERRITNQSKVMDNVKVFLRKKWTNRKTDRQTKGRTDRAKTICPRSIDAGS